MGAPVPPSPEELARRLDAVEEDQKDLHARVNALEKGAAKTDGELTQLGQLRKTLDGLREDLHTLDLRVTKLTERVTMAGALILLVWPFVTALAMRWIGR